MSKRTHALEKLIRQMVQTFHDLGADHMARLSVREWHAHYRRKAKKLKVEV